MDGLKSSFRGLSESPTQRTVALDAAERRGGNWKESLLVDLRSIIFIGVVCGKFCVLGINDEWSKKLFSRAFQIINPTRRSP